MQPRWSISLPRLSLILIVALIAAPAMAGAWTSSPAAPHAVAAGKAARAATRTNHPAAAINPVAITQSGFVPRIITITVGTSVQWTNQVTFTVQLGGKGTDGTTFLSPPITPNTSWPNLFTQPQVYKYAQIISGIPVTGTLSYVDVLPADAPTDTPVPADTSTDTPAPPTDTPTVGPCITPICPAFTPTPTDMPVQSTGTPIPPTATPTDTPPAGTITNTPLPSGTATNTPTPSSTPTTIPAPTTTSVPPSPPTAPPVNTPAPPAPPPPAPPFIPALPTSPPPPPANPSATPTPRHAAAPMPFVIHVPASGVISGGTLKVTVDTVSQAHVSITLQVKGTKVVFSGKGKHRKRTTRTVVLYQVGTQGNAAKGRFTGALHVTYAPVKPVQASLSVTVQMSHLTSIHKATVAILPRYQLLLAPDHGAAGAVTLISGRGFTPREAVRLKLSCTSSHCASGIVLAAINADAHGAFSKVRVTIPSSTAAGSHEIGAIGNKSHTFAWANFMVTITRHGPALPALVLAPDHGAAGAVTLVSGHGFGVREAVRLKLYCASLRCASRALLATVVTDAHGAFSKLRVTIPNNAPRGAHTLGAAGQQSKRFAQANYTVTKAGHIVTPPALVLAPDHGAAGAVTLVSGHGFGVREAVRLKLYCASLRCASRALLATVVTDAHGAFSKLRVVIPRNAPRGAHALGAAGQQSKRFALATFTVK